MLHDPGFEQPYGFEERIAQGMAIIIFWKGGPVRETPSPTYKAELESPVQHLRHWRHCFVVGPAIADCRGLVPRFGDFAEKHTGYIDNRSVPRVSRQARSHTLRQAQCHARSDVAHDLQRVAMGVRAVSHLT